MPAPISIYTPELGEKIINYLIQDISPQKICEIEGIAAPTIYGWMYKNEDFMEKISRARPPQAEAIEGKIAETIEKTKTGEMAPEVARVVLQGLQWRASKKNPKVYGDRQILAGDSENPLQMLALRLDQAIAKSEQLEAPQPMIDVTPVKDYEHDVSDLV